MTLPPKLVSVLWLVTSALPGQSARLAFLDVIARGRGGRPVADLRRDELRISDNSRPQSVVFFRTSEQPYTPPLVRAPHEFSNSSPGPPHPVAVIFDQRNSQVEAQGYQWDEIVRSLQQFETSEAIYFYVLTKTNGTLLPVHGLPQSDSDPAPAIGPWTSDILPQFQSMRNLYRGLPPKHDALGGFDSPLEATYYALHQVAADLAAFPGRKSIVWIGGATLAARPSDWLPSLHSAASPSQQRMADKTRELVAMLEVSHIAVYSVQRIGAAKSPRPDDQGVPQLLTWDTVPQLPDVTSGRKYEGDIRAAIADAVADGRACYRVGYAPPAANWDGRYHTVRVATSRRDLRVWAKQGYDASRLPGLAAAREQIAIGVAASSALDSAEIGLRVELSPAASIPGAVHLQIHLRAQDLLLLRQDGRYRGTLALQLVSYADDGRREVSGDPVPIDLDFSHEQFDTATRSGIAIPRDVPLHPHVRRVRLIVFDRGSENFGTLTVPVAEADRSEFR